MTPSSDPEGFIRTHTRVLPVPHAPEIRLHVADEATELWQRTEDELHEIGLPPPFWAFAWAGGQALARYLLDNPALVAGKRVLDFASGSGLCAIAAAKAGACHVVASDLDSFAITAIRLNAALNGVESRIEATQANLIGTDFEADLVLAADVFYERDLAGLVTGWLSGLHRGGHSVLIGDPGRTYLPKDRLICLSTYTVPVMRSLEDSDVKRSHVWRFED